MENTKIIGIKEIGVPYGFLNRRIEPGYMLEDHTALLECEKEGDLYVGGTGMDGMYLRTTRLYEAVKDETGEVIGFRRVR